MMQRIQDNKRLPLPGGETTERQLTLAIWATAEKKLEFKPLPGFNPNLDNLQYYRAQQDIDCDEVYPGIYIGDGITAKNKKYLKMLGITHLLNAAEGRRYGFVNTDNNYYADTTIKYLGLQVTDLPSVDISKYFYIAANFIDEAVSTGGKAFVNCMQGVSRSATCVLAYLMIKKNMLATDAIHLVRTNRDIHPNNGFLRQLAELDNRLRRQRLRLY
ncbi:dual specificity protein phosphatase 3 [Camponotus floridanus]|uniref:dual specificity protein phosphatase 3 n=1 Tax=Camponotus floridanus TaxID=104421 RepID=UPI000DC6B9D0|nr:dual specificity protein phosphatase 3 [Camponotus floridanus]XP_025264897.1 dual specificity protein phosphatase 3 [Camponotus floridanus]